MPRLNWDKINERILVFAPVGCVLFIFAVGLLLLIELAKLVLR